MYAIHGLFERWGALLAGIVLFALPVAGWSFGRPTIALLDTTAGEAQIIDLAPGTGQQSPTTVPPLP